MLTLYRTICIFYPMLLIQCTQVRTFRSDSKAIKGVAERFHTVSPVVVRAMVELWEASTDEQRKQALHKAATDTLEENNLEVVAVEERRCLMCRNPTGSRVSR